MKRIEIDYEKLKTATAGRQQQLAEVFGVGQPAVSQWVNGRRKISLDKLNKIAEFLKRDTLEFLIEVDARSIEEIAEDGAKKGGTQYRHPRLRRKLNEPISSAIKAIIDNGNGNGQCRIAPVARGWKAVFEDKEICVIHVSRGESADFTVGGVGYCVKSAQR